MFIFPGNCYIFEAGEAVQVQTIQKHQFAKLEIFTNFATLTNNFATLKKFFARVTEFSQPSQIFSQGLRNYATLIICTSSQPPFSFAYLISKALQTYASLKANSIFGILAFRSQDLQICTPVFLSSTSFTHRHPNSINRPPPPPFSLHMHPLLLLILSYRNPSPSALEPWSKPEEGTTLPLSPVGGPHPVPRQHNLREPLPTLPSLLS